MGECGSRERHETSWIHDWTVVDVPHKRDEVVSRTEGHEVWRDSRRRQASRRHFRRRKRQNHRRLDRPSTWLIPRACGGASNSRKSGCLKRIFFFTFASFFFFKDERNTVQRDASCARK